MRTWPLIAALFLTGCAKIPSLGELSDYLPKVTFKKLDVKDVDFKGAKSTFVLNIDNPHPVGLEIPAVNWDLDLGGADFLNGVKDTPISLKAQGVAPVRVPVDVKWKNIFDVVQGAKGKDNVPYIFGGDVKVNTPVGPLKVPFKHEGDLPVLHLPKVSLKALRVSKLDILRNTATLELDIGLASDQGSAIGVDGFNYDVKLSGTKVADGVAAISGVDGSTTATLPMNLKLLELGSTIVNAITKKTSLEVGLDADASFDTPLGVVPLKISETQKLQLK